MQKNRKNLDKGVSNEYIVNSFDNEYIAKRRNMRIQAGNAVRGNDFFKRKNLIKRIWELIDSGSNILIAAPRRVGKTSLMYYLKDNPRDEYIILFIDVESSNNENEFFRKLVNKVVKTEIVKNSRKALKLLEEHIPTIKKVGLDGLEFGVSVEKDYKDMLMRIFRSFETTDKNLVIMLDEFPETLENIIKDEGEKAGRQFLQSNRELRQDPEINKNVIFIYTGSIGLENVVSRLDAIKTINDLSRLNVPPLKKEQAEELIENLLTNCDFDLTEDVIDHILNQIEWLIPFYIQLVIEETRNIFRDENLSEISEKIIDQAFEQMLEQRNHFEHWHTRLRSSITSKEYKFAKEILNLISENETIHSNEILNIAIKYEFEDNYKEMINSLIYDGYINNNEDHHIYRFNSPILRMWWRKNVAN